MVESKFEENRRSYMVELAIYVKNMSPEYQADDFLERELAYLTDMIVMLKKSL